MRQSKKIKHLLSWILIGICFLFSMLFIKRNYYNLMNSDTTAEILLGKVLATDGGIVTDKWFYSTELRVISAQLVYKFFYYFFADNWFLIRISVCAVMLALLVASYIFMMKCFGKYDLGLYTAWILCLPFSQVYGYLVVYGAFYNNILAISFFILGIVFKLTESEFNIKKISVFILALICFISGLSGVRQAMICFIPLMLTAIWEIYMDLRTKNSISLKDISKENLNFFKIALFSSVSWGIGFLVSTGIICKKYGFGGQLFLWKTFSIHNVLETIGLFFCSFGQYDYVEVLRPYGIANVLSVCSVSLMIISLISLLANYKKIPYVVRIYAEFVLATTVITCALDAFTLSYAPITYWIPVIVLYIPFGGMIFEYDDIRINKLLGQFAVLVIAAHISLSSLCTFLKPNDQKINYCIDYSGLNGAAEFLMASDYTEGFAPFWLSNIMTELTKDKVDMWTVMAEAEDIDISKKESIYRWLQLKSHAETLPQGKFFIITYSNKFAEERNVIDAEAFYTLSMQDSNLVYSDDYARIYAFNNMDEFISLYNEMIKID